MVCFPFVAESQKTDGRIDSLKIYTSTITSETPDFNKYAANEKLQLMLENIFKSEKSFDFPFDSVKYWSALTSPDKKFKLLTWGIAKEDGTYEYFGYLFFPENSFSPKRFLKLTDRTDKILNPQTDVTDINNWYGAIYYKIIPTSYQGRKNYTLLGWKGNDQITTKKVIEVLSFRSTGVPAFGKQLFKKYKDKCARIIFEYSSRSGMLLRFDKQMIHTVTRPAKTVKARFNPKDRQNNKAIKSEKKIPAKLKTTKADMIVFDRLTPLDPRTSKYSANLEGQYQFYVPETNVFDAFVFTNGKWQFVKDVDARNPKPQKVKKFTPPQL